MYWVDRSTGEIVSERDKNKPLLKDALNDECIGRKTKEKTVKERKLLFA